MLRYWLDRFGQVRHVLHNHQRPMLKKLAFSLLLLIALSAPALGASRIVLASHRAFYELKLLRTDPTGAIASARGRLALEFNEVCDGYTLTQRLRTEIASAEGGVVNNDYTVTTWESFDGLVFRFRIHNASNAEPPEEYIGIARLTAAGRAGNVEFKKPERTKLVLPSGTVFPTEHQILLLRAALSGKRLVRVRVFDGGGSEGLNEASGFIGPELPKLAGEGALASLQGQRSWKGRVAYFPLKTGDERPIYEVGFRLFENGVGDDLVLDYGDYALSGTLTRLELLPRPSC
jgi:hypothetical protein